MTRLSRRGFRIPTRRDVIPVITIAAMSGLIACGGGSSVPPPPPASPKSSNDFPAGTTSVALTTADRMTGGPCSVSVDGYVWYSLPSGSLPAIDFKHVRCNAAATIAADVSPPIPNWAMPAGATQAIFVATSLQEAYSLAGMQAIERDAEGAGVPMTWMIGNPQYLTQNASYYNQLHASNGDDVQLEDNPSLYQLAQGALPWYRPSVSVEGAGRERNITGALALGNNAFWGITWNSHGTDNTSDEGTPWGTYCADIASYKRPSPSGNCTLVAFEWTARDLTRAYLANTNALGYSAEAAFSTDPDDVLLRAHFDPTSGAAYVRALVDAYAAAGTSQPLVMMSQQESMDEAKYAPSDDVVLSALYNEAKRSGMQTMTLRQAASVATTFSASPRAIAFPFIAGGASTVYNGVGFTPATIDYHDNVAGMTFISGHTLPARIFEYAQDPMSAFNRPLVETDPSSPMFPTLTGVTTATGTMSFRFNASVSTHIGVAIWTDPTNLGLQGANIVRASHAGFVAVFDVPVGASVQSIPCGACSSATFAYSR